jgi:hypothetical protein
MSSKISKLSNNKKNEMKFNIYYFDLKTTTTTTTTTTTI